MRRLINVNIWDNNLFFSCGVKKLSQILNKTLNITCSSIGCHGDSAWWKEALSLFCSTPFWAWDTNRKTKQRGADEETPGELYSQEVNSNQEFNTNTNLNKTIKKKVYCRFYMLSQFLNMNPKVFNTHQEIWALMFQGVKYTVKSVQERFSVWTHTPRSWRSNQLIS